jgi:Tol biopolymer transport system component
MTLALAIPAAAAADQSTIVYSKVRYAEFENLTGARGGLYLDRDGQRLQLTADPRDAEPAFAPDATRIVFARAGDLYSVRADGSGERPLTSGPALDSRPVLSPSGRTILFERRGSNGAPRDLYLLAARAAQPRLLTGGPGDDREASFSPEGRAIVFVRSSLTPGGSVSDLYSARPGTGTDLARLTTGGLDDFAPRFCAGGIVFNRGEREDEGGFADVLTMRRDGRRPRVLLAGGRISLVQDVSPDGTRLLFRRSGGLWERQIRPGERARKLSSFLRNTLVNALFAPDGRSLAQWVQTPWSDELRTVRVKDRADQNVVNSDHFSDEPGTWIGPGFAWEPRRSAAGSTR